MSKVNDTIKHLDTLDLDAVGHDENERRLIISAAYRMLARLETPFEQTWKFTTTINTASALQTLIGLGLWQGWKEDGGNVATLEELSKLCNSPCDLGLLRRLLRVMSASHFVEEVGEDKFQPTPTSLALGDTAEPIAHTALVTGAQYTSSAVNLPAFLAKTDYREPLEATNTNFMDSNKDQLSLFAFLKTDPKSQAAFIGAMRGLSQRKRDWTEFYSTELLFEGFNPDKVLLVDIGGGHGLDVGRMLAKHSDRISPGNLVLQDLPTVTAIAKVSDQIQLMPHDFFTPQPVKGARAYFMRSVLHDWNDEDAKRILQETVAAMEKGHSKLLICDLVLPSTGANLYQASADMMMMHLHSARERTEAQWKSLLEAVGLQVVKIWNDVSSTDCILEAELA